ncbi:MAG: 3-methyladenine DNA glycosylase AlkD [Planctomycetota bacterium]|jgi:3-methyladenine DNA glycosylase AlkD
MTKAEVLSWLEAEQDPRGVEHWQKQTQGAGGLKSYGVGLTRLRKYAKQLGRDAKLAKTLWKSKVYEAKVIALLIDDPKTMTVAQAEAQVEELAGGHLAHVFSSCDATLAKAPFVRDLAEKWMISKDQVRKGCGYGLIYELAKSKKKSAPDEAAFLGYIKGIEKAYSKQPIATLMAMGGALMGIGTRSKKLNAAALRVARKIGPIDFDPNGRCPPFDVVKHLANKAVTQRLGK